MAKVSDFTSIRLRIASPEDILKWSHGEVTKPETINYRTQKPEKDGLFCERIFGPEKDYECYCGKYRRIRYKGIICDKCGVEVTRSIVRRERLGHIKLAVPVAHIWFLRGIPSQIGLILDIPTQQLEKVVYYASYIVISVDEEQKKEANRQIDEEFKRKVKTDPNSRKSLETIKSREVDSIKSLKVGTVFSEVEYFDLSLKYGECFSAGTGSETLIKLMSGIDLKDLRNTIEKQVDDTQGVALRKALRRLKAIRGFVEAGSRPEWMFMTMLPVLPPELRPMVQLDGGRYATSDLNDLYRRVINRNNRLKRLQDINAPEVICRNEKRMLQEAVDALIDNSARKTQTVTATTGGKRLLKSLADMLKGKQGRFRQNLLGKRVDYSGRSVIVVGPSLELHQCGLPKKMALELFRPFVIQKIIERELAYNIRAAGRLIEEGRPEIWEILEEVIQGKHVLLNRAPTLHRLGIQAFQPVLIEGDAIQIHPLVCAAFNADFDGDQMAVHVPLSEEAQHEAATIMLSSANLLKPATGSPIATPTKDIVLGCYWMSKMDPAVEGKEDKRIRSFGSQEEVLLAYDTRTVGLKEKVRVRFNGPELDKISDKDKETGGSYVETCVGRILFNKVLPDDFQFVNEDLNSRALRDITSEIYEKYGVAKTSEILDGIKELGFLYATLSGISWAMGDLSVPPEKPGILDEARGKVEIIRSQFNEGLLSVEERRFKIIEVWQQARQEITKLVPNYLDPEGAVSLIANSGARGSWSQIHQMTAMRGLAVNPSGQTMELPVESSFKEGLTPLEYFISTHGARKGTADTALRTATAGYLTRRLVDVSQDVVVKEEDCKDSQGLDISKDEAEITGQTLSEKLIGRVLMEARDSKKKYEKNTVIDSRLGQELEKDEEVYSVVIRSPMTCKTIGGVCAKCYGWDLGKNAMVKAGEAVGIVAAQAIGEPGTQLTMRTFHTGGVAGTSDITQGLPRVEEVFEARSPKGRACISEVGGTVTAIKDDGKERILLVRMDASSLAKAKPAKRRGRKSSKDLDPQSVEYRVPKNVAILVAKNDVVSPGMQLSEGNIDLHDLFTELGRRATEKYIIEAIQKIYTSQGANIHDKHIEIIVRQMFSRVRITKSGGSVMVPGEVIEYADVAEENKDLKKQGKKPIEFEDILLGVTKAALTSSSFLSAASFQETSRVLIDAAVMGKEDPLEGLKENVIIGKLIPAGTGYRKE